LGIQEEKREVYWAAMPPNTPQIFISSFVNAKSFDFAKTLAVGYPG